MKFQQICLKIYPLPKKISWLTPFVTGLLCIMSGEADKAAAVVYKLADTIVLFFFWRGCFWQTINGNRCSFGVVARSEVKQCKSVTSKHLPFKAAAESSRCASPHPPCPPSTPSLAPYQRQPKPAICNDINHFYLLLLQSITVYSLFCVIFSV